MIFWVNFNVAMHLKEHKNIPLMILEMIQYLLHLKKNLKPNKISNNRSLLSCSILIKQNIDKYTHF